MLKIEPNPATHERTKKVILKHCWPMQVIEPCLAASLSYKVLESRTEKRTAPIGFPSCMKLKITPKFFRPKISDARGTIIEYRIP